MSLEQIIEAWKQKPIREVIRELYIDQDMSMRGVAEELHLSLGQIYNLCKKYGISKNNDLFDPMDTPKKLSEKQIKEGEKWLRERGCTTPWKNSKWKKRD